ncbi:hypothetical protein [Conexibacter woesei]|uniref:Uncharacterized protein n=1 Tax=Conexibacter woesei (strain DSM 14684 / CCUG 47730 / CIP 108061 / JCM 11494 / NBRC 100937 / ID131577) TaxID=469383 RepID=D3F306_CONWI|nr:hypothetical protein [Conexibacter woesei]ADB54287.1 hypothetical protein Cwoe_5887 [Conexibacter woesei DSM 14684]
MPPTDRYVIRFAAEPPQETLPYGRWADTLAGWFKAAVAEIDPGDEELGNAGEIVWYPDRTYGTRTYVPATARTTEGYELFGYVSFGVGDNGAPDDFAAHADFTSETADANPDWQIDLNEEVIGSWRGEGGRTADITLIWGVPLVKNGAIVTAELADLSVDQCELVDYRFTLIAPDAYRSDFLDVKLFSAAGDELARESLYVEDDDEDEDDSTEE